MEIKKLKEKLEVNDTALDDELARQPGYFMYAVEVAASAEQEYEAFKLKVEELEAVLDSKIRASFEAEGKKYTEKLVEQEINRTQSYREAKERLLALRMKRDEAKGLKDAFYMKKDLLIQIAINKRAEMESLSVDKVIKKLGQAA